MKDDKNIDSIIRKKLEGFSVPPPPHVWENVQGQLTAQQRRIRRMYFGWISVAAVVVLAFLAGWYFNGISTVEENASITNEIIQLEKSTAEKEVQPAEIAMQNAIEQSSDKSKEIVIKETSGLIAVASINSKTESIKSENNNKRSTSRETVILARMESADARVAQKQLPNTALERNIKIIPANYLSESEQFLIAENIKNIKASTEPDNNWKMGMFVAPGYSSHTSSHTESYAQNMTYSGSEGNTNVSGGISVQYKTSKRWIVESGVYYAQNGQESENSINLFVRNNNAEYGYLSSDVPYFANVVQVQNNNLAMNSAAGVIEFSGTPKGAELSGNFDALKTDVGNLIVPNGSFSQVFEFMEIPLFVRYRLIDSKFGVEMITGLNAGIVIGNNAYIDNQFGVQNIGETRDISTVNLSGTVGVGLNYALGKHFAVAVEPRFNYYLNSINTNSSIDFRPYRIGFYTGVSYEF